MGHRRAIRGDNAYNRQGVMLTQRRPAYHGISICNVTTEHRQSMAQEARQVSVVRDGVLRVGADEAENRPKNESVTIEEDGQTHWGRSSPVWEDFRRYRKYPSDT
jgi:hypothetical protein